MGELMEFLQSGGPVMVPIALVSLVALTVFLWRLAMLRQSRIAPRSFVVEIEDLVKQGRHADALTVCRKQDSIAAARVVAVAIEARGGARGHIKERLEEIGRREAADLELGADILGTMAAIAPLLGLLGTVWGMIQTFEVIQDQGMGMVGSLAGGISQALITTLAGLSVGIPAVVAHRWVLGSVDSLVMELETVSLQVLDLVAAKEPGQGGTPDQGGSAA